MERCETWKGEAWKGGRCRPKRLLVDGDRGCHRPRRDEGKLGEAHLEGALRYVADRVGDGEVGGAAAVLRERAVESPVAYYPHGR